MATRVTPFAILLDGTLALDRYYGQEVGGVDRLARAHNIGWNSYYFLAPSHGRIYSAYPLALPLLLTPFYAPVVWILGIKDWSVPDILSFAVKVEKAAASLIVALSAGVLYLLARRRASPQVAWLVALGFAFATPAWSTASQGLWQHGPGILLILLALLALDRDRLWGAGVAAGLAFAVRPTNLFLWLAVLAVLISHRRSARDIFGILIPGVVIGAGVVALNFLVFGHVIGGVYANANTSFSGDFATGFFGLLFSPNRGLFIFAPILVIGVIGARFGVRRRDPLYETCTLFALSQVAIFASWYSWWGGWSYGPRLLTEAATALVVLCLPAREWLRAHSLRARTGLALLAYSCMVQAIGAFGYTYGPDGWDGSSPELEPPHRNRYWEWRDLQIARTAKSLFT